jgi:type IV pilus assembly protein PilP
MNRNPARRRSSAFLPALLTLPALLLTSCAERETPHQLRGELEMIRRGIPATTPLIQLTGDFIPYAYTAASDDTAMTPFGHPGASIVDDKANERPRQRGARQPLEDIPLESIRMVGTLSRDGRTDALLQVDRIVYPSRSGDYLGQNFGVIRHISDGRVELEELIRSNGDWEKRMTTLELQGRGK